MNTQKIISAVLALIIGGGVLSSCGSAPKQSSISASDGYEFYADWLEEKLGSDSKNILIGDSETARSYGIDMTDFGEEGFLIRTVDDTVVIFGADEMGVDRGVHDYIINGGAAGYSRTYNEGYRVNRITLAGYDISEYVIAIPEDADENVIFAAENIRDYTKKACGAVLDITTESCERAITFVKDETGTLGTDGFTITTADGSMTITHGIYRGALNGAMEFLEAYMGWRFVYKPYGWDEAGESGIIDYLYESDHVVIEAGITDTQTPSMEYRDVYDGGTYVRGAEAYSYKVKYNGEGTVDKKNLGSFNGLMLKSCHGMLNMGNATFKEITNNYAKQPCYSDDFWFEEIGDRAVSDSLAQVRSGKVIGVDFNCYDIGSCDSQNFCQCTGCLEIIAEEGANSGGMLRFVNYIADRISAEPELEGLYVSCLAYYGSNKPPLKTVPRENVQVSYCFYVDPSFAKATCGSHCFSGDNCKDSYFNTYGEEFEKWCEITSKVSVWYYQEGYYHAVPETEFSVMYENMKYMAEMGCYGIFYLSSASPLNFGSLRQYLAVRLMWNADMSLEEYYGLIKEYFMICYGDKVGESLYEYVLMLEGSKSNECYVQIRAYPFERYSEEYFAGHYAEISNMFDSMLKNAETFEVYELLEQIRLHTDFLGLSAVWEDMYENGTDTERAFVRERYREHYENAMKYGYTLGEWSKRFTYPEENMDFEIRPYDYIDLMKS